MLNQKIKDAVDAIDRVHQDTSVSLEDSLAALETIKEHLDFLVCAVEEDIKRANAKPRRVCLGCDTYMSEHRQYGEMYHDD